MPEAAGFEGVSDRSTLQEFSVSSSESFWAAAARHRVDWISPFHLVQDCDLSRGKIRWFGGGKLNVSGKIKCTFDGNRARSWICGKTFLLVDGIVRMKPKNPVNAPRQTCDELSG